MWVPLNIPKKNRKRNSVKRLISKLSEKLRYPQLLGHHAGHQMSQVSPHRVPQSLIFTCQASQDWECAMTSQHHALIQKNNEPWHIHNRTCSPMMPDVPSIWPAHLFCLRRCQFSQWPGSVQKSDTGPFQVHGKPWEARLMPQEP